MGDQRTDGEGGWLDFDNPQFRAELDELLSWVSEFTIEREPLSEQDHQELKKLLDRMGEFKKRWPIRESKN